MDFRLRRVIDETAEELGITQAKANEIWVGTNKVIYEMMGEGSARDPDTYKRIFLRNVGTFDVKVTTKYALKKQFGLLKDELTDKLHGEQ